MQNINSKQTLKDLQKFPDIFTFKIVGDNNNRFLAEVMQIFDNKANVSFSENISKTGKYISVSATLEVLTYEELEEIYTKISKLEGLKFYV